jgi:hypothetical protein
MATPKLSDKPANPPHEAHLRMTDWALQMAYYNFSSALMHVGGQNVYYNVSQSLVWFGLQSDILAVHSTA